MKVTSILPLLVFLVGFATPAALCGADKPKAAQKKTQEKVVIPFDFESRFDSGRYGRMVGSLIWKKLEREKRFVIPESMIDVRDVCDRIKFHPSYSTKAAEIGKVLRKEFGGHIAIWGSIERVPPNTTDVYDLSIKVVDFSRSKPTVIYDGKHRTKSVSEIPHLYVKNMMRKLLGRKPGAPPAPDPVAEKRWNTAPNLLRNGSFEKGASQPTGWDRLPTYVSLVKNGGTRHLKMQFPKDVAATTGVLYYSEFFPVEAGATYRFSCRYRTSGSAVKVFVKCYDLFEGRRGRQNTPDQRREVYRSQQNLKGSAGKWHTHVEDFTPTHAKYHPRWGRVMLYAYWPAGTVEWDDVVVKQIRPPADKPATRSRN
jgi:hypothetical protein